MSKLRENKVEKNAWNSELLNLMKHQSDLSFFSNLNICFVLQFLWVRNVGAAYLGGSGPVSHIWLLSRCQLGLQDSFQGGSFYRIDQMMLVVDRRPQFFPCGPLHATWVSSLTWHLANAPNSALKITPCHHCHVLLSYRWILSNVGDDHIRMWQVSRESLGVIFGDWLSWIRANWKLV